MFPLCTMWLCNRIFSFSLNYTVKSSLRNKQVCPKFINVIIENNQSHTSGAKSMLCNVMVKGYLLSSHSFICACLFCFAVTWCTLATSMCSSVSYNKPGIKPETYDVMWHVYPESKIQLVNCEMSPKCLLGHLSLSDIHATDLYIFWSLIFLLLSHAPLTFSLKRTWFSCFYFYFGWFGHFGIWWSSVLFF